jgi:hypothetical protein
MSIIANITQVFLVGDSVDIQPPNRIHVGLCLCYRIVSAEVDVLKGKGKGKAVPLQALT